MLAFLFLPDDKITIAPDAGLSADSIPTLTAAYEALAAVQDFDHAASSRRCVRRWSTIWG